MAVEHLALGTAFGAGGQHILLAQLLQERVFGQQSYRRKRRQAHRGNRQNQMPEVIEDFLPPWQLRPGVRYQTAQRKELEERAARKQDDEQDREQKTRNGIADDDDAGRPDVEWRAVIHRLANAKRNREQIAQQRHPDSERDRNRQLLLDQLQHADVAEIALAEVEAHIIPQHDEEALIGRLVEAELLLETLDESG